MFNQAEANLSALIESTEDLIWSVDLDHRLVAFNCAVQRAFEAGYGVRIGPGMTPREVLLPERAALFPPLYQRALAEGPFRTEYILRDGRTLELSFNPIVADGKATGISVFGKDISKRIATERALQEAEEKYRDIFEGALEGMFQVSLESKLLTANPALAEILGYDSPEEMAAGVRNVLQDVWADLDEHAAFMQRLAEDGVVRNFECRLKRKDRTVTWVSVSARKVLDADGRLLRHDGFMQDISERKAAESALKEAERRHDAIFDGALEGMLQTTFEGRPLKANPALARMLGYDSPGELVSTIRDTARDMWVEPSERSKFLRQLNVHGVASGFECHLRRKGGTGIWASITCRKVLATDGATFILDGMVQDITERKRAAQALAESEDRFRSIFEKNGSVMLLVDPRSGAIVDANLAATAFYSYSRERLIGMPISEINTLPREETALERERALREERNHFAFRHRLASGEVRDVEVYSSRIDISGKALLFEIVHDVTDRARADQALRESAESLAEAQRIGGLGSYALDISSGVWTSSDVLDEIFGIGKDYEHTIAGWTALIHPADRAMITAYFMDEVLGKRKVFDKEYRIVRQNDQVERWVRTRGRLELDDQGRPVKMRGVIKDVNERKQAEMQLRKSEERYRETFEQAAVGMIHTSLEGEILRCNARFAEIVGYLPEEVPGLTFQQITFPADLPESVDVLYRLPEIETDTATWEKRYIRKDGSLTWVRVTTSMQRDAEGRALHYIAVVQDINARKDAEERLAASTEALQVSESRYRSVFQTCPDAVMVSRMSDGRIFDANQAFFDSACYERNEVIGRTTRELGIWVDSSDRKRLVDELLRHGHCRDLEVRSRRKNGEEFWMRLSASMIEIEGCKCLLSFGRNISEARSAEQRLAAAQQALQSSEERYRTAFQTSLDGIAISRMSDGRYIDVNAAFLQLMGFEREEVVGRTSLELGFWVDPEVRTKMIAALREHSQFRDMETQYVRKNGETIWILVSGTAIEIEGVSCILSVIRDVSADKAAELRLAEAAEALRASEGRYRATFEMSIDAININRLSDGVFVDVNEAFLSFMGWRREEIIGRTSEELDFWVDPNDRRRMIETLRQKGSCQDLEARFRRKNGEIVWGQASESMIEIDGVPCILSVTRDISAAKAADERLAAAVEALRISEERYRNVFQTSLDCITLSRMSDGVFTDVNQAFLDLMGFEYQEVIERSSDELNLWEDQGIRPGLAETLRLNSSFRDVTTQLRKKNGELFWALMSASLIELDGVSHVLCVMRDVSGAKAAEEQIRDLAFYDPLTHLPNRRLLLEQLRQSLAASSRTSRKRALLFVDLDNFKNLNDTLGHHTGDLLLQEVAKRLSGCVRESDTVARLGGDEFVVMLEDLSDIPEEAAAQAEAVGEKLLGAIDQPFILSGHECLSTSSIGITVFGDKRESTNEVLQQADIAMYQAKAAGRNTMRFFAPALQAAVNARAALEDDIRQAIKANEFVLYYQPQVDSIGLIGAEALIRWQHPRRGLLAPGQFISLAEETGLILPLGDWVLETACAQVAAWADQSETAQISVAVNISAGQFRHPGFVEKVLATLERTGANPRNVKLELTESMLVDNIEDVIAKMTELKTYGLGFSLDDFGTGYSSLAYLKRLPFDQLKIDSSFVRDIVVDVGSRAIAQSVISLGRALGLSVIAECVESEEQRVYLSRLGCNAFQGYLFSRPLPLEEFERLWLPCAADSFPVAS